MGKWTRSTAKEEEEKKCITEQENKNNKMVTRSQGLTVNDIYAPENVQQLADKMECSIEEVTEALQEHFKEVLPASTANEHQA